MQIEVNGVAREVEESLSLKSLLEQLEISSQGVAVALNHQVISKTAWGDASLNPGDQVIIIRATCGG